MTRGVKRKLQNAHDTSCELSYTTGRPPKAPAPLFMDDSDGLCEDCANIGLDEVLRRNEVDHHLGTFVCHLAEISKLESSPCRLCRYFATMRWQIQDPTKVLLRRGSPLPSAHSEKRIGILASQSHLRAFSAFRRFGLNRHQRNLKKVSDTVFLAVVPGKDWGNGIIKNIMSDCGNTAAYFTRTHGTSTLPNETFFGRKVSPKYLDYSLISSWISFCDMSHKKICGRRERGSIPDFRVVDCSSRKIVPAPPDCQYIALSYLWGTITTEQGSENKIPSAQSIPLSCPEVIEDALEVVKRLGHQYLWIDRFCIDQNNKDQKHIQIANMDSIYSNATLTIIAAAGADPSSGLPGARLQRRIQQPCVQIGANTLVSTFPNPRIEIENSKWNSWAWTYQEGLLSRRRLVFTPHQVYFQCDGMHCFESISMPLKSLHLQNLSRFADDVKFYRMFPLAGTGRNTSDILSRIEEYSTKSLSYESDVLNAMLGIFKQFEKIKNPIHQFWGLPILIGSPIHTPEPVHYSPSERLALALSWQSHGTAKRRHDLPSWSWMGWTELTGLCYAHRTDSDIDGLRLGNTTYDVEIDAELNDGSLLRWSSNRDADLKKHLPTYNLPDCSPFLHIRAWTLKLKFMTRRFQWWITEPSTYDLPSWHQGSHEDWQVERPLLYTMQDPFCCKLGNNLWDGVVLSHQTHNSLEQHGYWETCLVVLVVEPDESCFRRVGTVTAWFRESMPLTVDYEKDEACIGKVKLSRRSLRLG